MTEHAQLSNVDGFQAVTIDSPEGELTATFVLGAGMVCSSLCHAGEELLAQNRGVRAYAKRGATMGIPLLHPWANRLSGFRYEGPAGAVELPRASSLLSYDEHGLPIHGVVPGHLPWQLLAGEEDSAGSGLRAILDWSKPELLAVFPFPHALELRARLRGTTLALETTLRPSSELAVPASFGYHPYLTIPGIDRSEWRVELPVTRRLLLDERMIPTGASEAVASPSFTLGQSSWDDAFTGLTRPARFSVAAGGRRIELEFLHGYPFAQVYSPPAADFICFEPMTAPANALLDGSDIQLVQPREELRAAFRVSVGDC